MLKELGQVTPHRLLDKIGFVIHKPKPDESLVCATIDNLPIVDRSDLKLHGCGDWSKGRSSAGSVVLAGNDFVLKIPLGEQSHDKPPLVKARELSDTAKKFEDVSPSTGFFIARVDGPEKPAKVIIFQSKNHGRPAYDTALGKLLSPEVARPLGKIIDRMVEVLQKDNLLDGIGIHLDNSSVFKRFIIRIICGIPLISDNIMVDEDNKVELVDNVPALEAHEYRNPVKKQLNSLRLIFSKKLLLFSSQAYSFITRS